MTSEAPIARPPATKSLTIGAVCKSLEREFPDISISKIRYLEDQKLLAPRRTRGGYRLYAPDDVQRLRTILRLQRDEFLPLRVIRQELASGRADADVDRTTPAADPRALRRVTVLRKSPESLYSLAEVLAETGASAELVKELEDYGIVEGPARGRRLALRRDRARDHQGGGRAREVRRRRPQPARVPDLGRPRGRAARADPRLGAEVAQSGPPARGRRGARQPGRGRVAPEAPAARARPSPHGLSAGRNQRARARRAA